MLREKHIRTYTLQKEGWWWVVGVAWAALKLLLLLPGNWKLN